jgi:hypothetical protein
MEKTLAVNSAGQKNREDSDGLAYSYEHVDGLDVPSVTWWKDPGLRKLYIMMPVLFLGSTINRYDGSLLNGLQTMTPWQTFQLACILISSVADHGLQISTILACLDSASSLRFKILVAFVR